MPAKHSTIVLKFGGSVLLSPERLRVAVHEIYRWRRDGYRVVAVVSALAGRTEELISLCDTHCPNATAIVKAGLIAQGEHESAALLGVQLDRAGIPCCVLSAASIGLRVDGDPLNANPIEIDRVVIDNALDRDGVVIIPGFVGIDYSGRTCTLGRGGSDLTAVFVAHQLRADVCRLIKDVDGLYVSDPAASTPPPAKYQYANYEDAHGTDGSIVQYKAIEYAQRYGVEIELGGFNSINPTTIGPAVRQFEDDREELTPTRVLVCGLGTAGGGVIELLRQLPDQFEIVGGVCRDPEKHAGLGIELHCDTEAVSSCDADMVIELIGGIETPHRIVDRAIRSGKHVVSANKALIASKGNALRSLADQAGVNICYAASVGGGVPVLEWTRWLKPERVRGVLNGTCNFVLGQVAQGRGLDEAIEAAQRLGFAEANPTRDLDGRDALDKLIVIAQALGNADDLETSCEDLRDHIGAKPCSVLTKQVGTLTRTSARVCLEQTLPGSVFAGLTDEWNGVEFVLSDGRELTLKGRGAGRWATSESVLGDVLEIRRQLVANQIQQKEVDHGCLSV